MGEAPGVEDYRVVSVQSRGAMAMLIFAWKMGPPWHGIAFAAENTGLGHVFPNKGGLLAKMEVGVQGQFPGSHG